MKKTILTIDGMMCGMCESHVNDAIRANFNVILSENAIDEKKAAEVLGALGYKVTAFSEEEYKKKGFPFFK